jgi:hypothetical protein
MNKGTRVKALRGWQTDLHRQRLGLRPALAGPGFGDFRDHRGSDGRARLGRTRMAGSVRLRSRTTAASASRSWPLPSVAGSAARSLTQRRFRDVLGASCALACIPAGPGCRPAQETRQSRQDARRLSNGGLCRSHGTAGVGGCSALPLRSGSPVSPSGILPRLVQLGREAWIAVDVCSATRAIVACVYRTPRICRPVRSSDAQPTSRSWRASSRGSAGPWALGFAHSVYAGQGASATARGRRR